MYGKKGWHWFADHCCGGHFQISYFSFINFFEGIIAAAVALLFSRKARAVAGWAVFIGALALIPHLAPLAMAAKAPRERVIGTLNYKRNSFDQVISPNGFPNLIYDRIILRGAGTHNKAGSVLGTAAPENPFTIIKSVKLLIAQTSVVEIPGTDLVVLSHYISPTTFPTPGKAPVFTASTTAFTNDAFSFELYLPFRFSDLIPKSRRRGFFPSGRYANVTFRIDFGSELDLVSGGTYSTNSVTNFTVDIVAKEWSMEQAFETKSDYLLHKRGGPIIVPNAGVAWSLYSNEIPRDPSLLRGILLKTYTDGPETPVTNLLTGTNRIQLVYNKVDIKFDYTVAMLQNMNTEKYRIALPPGYLFLDLLEDGDLASLQDTSSGVYELKTDSAAVAANLRILPVRYAKGN